MQRSPLTWILLLLLATASPALAAAPPTVYESVQTTAENMDYDAANLTFRAHPGWLNDRLVHYYKFRMYTPETYPMQVDMEGNARIPVMPLYLATTDGTMGGLVAQQRPILRYHHADGGNYSDFAEVVLYRVANGYVPDTHRSFADLESAGVAMNATGAYVNAPLVPVGSKLAAPVGGIAPIKPVPAWYAEDEVQLFFFETTSRAFADFFNPRTREGEAAEAGSGYEIVVAPFVRGGNVSSAPIWHFNQYGAGSGQGGGPASGGQRNVIAVDRRDPGYSPLWQVYWISKLPVGYEASQASHPDQITVENGFAQVVTPMFVNCPNVGPHGGGANNTAKAASFRVPGHVPEGGSATLQGALVMRSGENVTVRVGDRVVGNATTGMMGAYAVRLDEADLPSDARNATVHDASNETVATFSLQLGGAPPSPAPTGPTGPGEAPEEATGVPGPLAGVILLALAAAARARARRP